MSDKLTAKTILITNNYQNGEAANNGLNGGRAGNSITIVTSATPPEAASNAVVLDRINICINNHYDAGSPVMQQQVMSIKQEKHELSVAKCGGFREGDDVLVHQEDGRFFFGTVVVATATQCLVRYDDDTKKWANHRQVKRFGGDKEEETGPLCVVCKERQSEKVEVCDNCGRGYHLKCSDGDYNEAGTSWLCHK